MNNPKDEAQNSKIARDSLTDPERIPELGASISLAGRYHAAAGQHYVAHRHRGHELIVWRSGHVECLLGADDQQRTVAASPGMVTLWPGRLLHADRALTAYSHVYLNFEHNLTLAGFEQPRCFFDDEAGTAERLVLAIETEFNSVRTHRAAMLQLQLQQLAVVLARLNDHPPDPAERLVRRMERLIEEHYAANPNLQELASGLQSSTSHLRAQFARLRGYSPKAYLQQVRLRHVLGYIRNSFMTLDEIAVVTGYASSGHLWHDVRRLTGKTPGSFRSPADRLPGHPADEPPERT